MTTLPNLTELERLVRVYLTAPDDSRAHTDERWLAAVRQRGALESTLRAMVRT